MDMRPDLDRKLRHRQPREVRGLRIGSLFSGYGGLDMGVMAALGGSVAWHVEFDKAPSKILAHHWPDVPNYGDVTAVDWAVVEPVDVITGGSPCQDLSHAGKRQGMTEGTRSNLWVAMREAIAQLRPGLVVWENVRGAYSAAADSEVEPCSGCLGGAGHGQPSLRALGRVLGDLSDLGYDCRWHGLRAVDVGAPHGRFRVFVAAYPKGDSRWLQHGDGAAASGTRGLRRGAGWPTVAGEAPGGWPPADLAGRSDTSALLGTPTARDGKGSGQGERLAESARRGQVEAQVLTLLPTPAVADAEGGHATRSGARSGELLLPGVARAHAEGRLLPTPTSMDSGASGGNPHTTGTHGTTLTDATVRNPQDWGIYADAIARWEALTRPAPAPTQPSKKGTPQLSPAFSEWLMGLPEGHVTGVPGLSRNDMLKALGNGVVPQQAEAALRFLLGAQEVAA